MIPVISQEIETEVNQQSKTWGLSNNRLVCQIDGLKAVIQAAYFAIQTPRYKHLIYSWQYGSELETLIGKNEAFVLSESRRMIIDALSIDNRVTNVRDFFYIDKILYFTIDTIYGSANLLMEGIIDENL